MSPAKRVQFRAFGRVVRAGETLMVCLGEVFVEDAGRAKQIALMTTTMMVAGTQTGLRD